MGLCSDKVPRAPGRHEQYQSAQYCRDGMPDAGANHQVGKINFRAVTNSNAAVDRRDGNHTTIILVTLALSLLVGAIAISNQSLWIDEAWSASKAMQPSFGSWWATMASDKGSDL